MPRKSVCRHPWSSHSWADSKRADQRFPPSSTADVEKQRGNFAHKSTRPISRSRRWWRGHRSSSSGGGQRTCSRRKTLRTVPPGRAKETWKMSSFPGKKSWKKSCPLETQDSNDRRSCPGTQFYVHCNLGQVRVVSWKQQDICNSPRRMENVGNTTCEQSQGTRKYILFWRNSRF